MRTLVHRNKGRLKKKYIDYKYTNTVFTIYTNNTVTLSIYTYYSNYFLVWSFHKFNFNIKSSASKLEKLGITILNIYLKLIKLNIHVSYYYTSWNMYVHIKKKYVVRGIKYSFFVNLIQTVTIWYYIDF